MKPFNLNHSIALWRRSRESNRAFTADDLDELEQHLRDQVAGLVAGGLTEEEAFRTALAEMGDYGSAETEYGKVYWGKLKRRPNLSNEWMWRSSMIKNYLKTAVRNLIRARGYAAINVVGLAVSMSLCLLILLFVQDQYRYDRFHDNANRIYRINSHFEHGTRAATSPYSLGLALREGIPGVEAVVRLKRFQGSAGRNETRITVKGLYAEPSFFDIFSFPLARGNRTTILYEPNTVVLSEETAQKLFPDRDPVGQFIRLDGKTDLTVTGVLEPMPLQTNLKFDALVSFGTLEVDRLRPDWGFSAFEYYNYVLVGRDVAPERLRAHFPGLIKTLYTGHPDIKIDAFDLQPITGIRLGPMLANQHAFTLPPVIVYALVGIALMIMLIACFNYMSLSIARSINRAKEIGVRKVIGAQRGQLTAQFIGEALILSMFAFVGAFLLLFWLVPSFNQMWIIRYAGTPITIDFVRDGTVWLSFLAFSMLVGLVAGLYPALYLASFQPVGVLKGLASYRGSSRLRLRKVLAVVQFTFSLFFIVSTLLLHRQAGLMLTSDYGFDRDYVVNVDLQGESYERFRQVLEKYPQVVRVSASSLLPGTSDSQEQDIWTDHPSEPPNRVAIYSVDEAFVDNLQLKLVAGRKFSTQFSTDTSNAVILNEAAVRTLGMDAPTDAPGKTIHVGFAHRPQDASDYQVIGVVRDFHYNRLEAPVGPMMLRFRPASFQFANVRMAPGDLKAGITVVEAAWNQFGPAHPFSYQLYDDRLAEEYAIYQDVIGILGITSGFAILIACLGLLGMVTYSMETRTKEIGVRKVMGARVPGLFLLLSRDYLKLVSIAILIGGPLSWFVNQQWLSRMALRAPFDGWVFIPAILGLLVLALVTVGSRTLRAALSNPVDTLRYE